MAYIRRAHSPEVSVEDARFRRFSEAKRTEYAAHLDNFQTKITFEEIEREFLHLAAWRQENDHGVLPAMGYQRQHCRLNRQDRFELHATCAAATGDEIKQCGSLSAFAQALWPAKITERCLSAISFSDVCRTGAVRNAVGIRCGAFSGNMKVSFQAARSIG